MDTSLLMSTPLSSPCDSYRLGGQRAFSGISYIGPLNDDSLRVKVASGCCCAFDGLVEGAVYELPDRACIGPAFRRGGGEAL